ncbi:MAG: allophanate hydrolase subunit 1 [Actinobacteria bacterium]|nr:allophanate hydrolase subunit 1 [Actinomycetota bacterium]
MKLLPYGPRAVLAEFDSLAEVMAAAAAWRAARLTGVVDVVPAARTVLVVHDGYFDAASLVQPQPAHDAVAVGQLVTIDTAYDGEDLAAVADSVGMSADEVVQAHSAAEYTVAFCGFMPGFSYLVGLDRRLVVARRATPRTRVPAGSVAIAAEFSAVYPRESPGGWHLLGRTEQSMWDERRLPPALLPPGTRVRFRPR